MSSDEYATAEEGDDDEGLLEELGFFLYTATDGTPWYLPRYFRADLPRLTPTDRRTIRRGRS